MNPNAFVGTLIAGSYEVLSVTGSGGMGTVFKAKQLGLDRYVAIKILDPAHISDENAQARFEREGKSISRLSHQHIAGFYSFGELENSMPFIVMEWLEGASLLSIIQEEAPLPPDRAINIAVQICQALDYAHSRGIFHRDLKPANVLLVDRPEPDFVKLLDFGLARVDESCTFFQKLTQTGTLLGTPQYFSPEHCLGQKIDARSDIYSLGCIIYEMLCARPPFQGAEPMALINMHLNLPVPPLSGQSRADSPAGLEAVLGKCLEKNPQNRYQNAGELQRAIEIVQDGKGDSLLVELRSARTKSYAGFAGKGRLLVGGCLIVLLALVLFFAISESGQLALSSLSLRFDRSWRSLLFWQGIAEKLYESHRFDAANRLELQVERCLYDTAKTKDERIDLYLQLASDLLARGDNHSAFDYALKALKEIAVVDKSQQPSEGILTKEIERSEKAAALIAESSQPVNLNQFRTLLAVASKEQVELERNNKDQLLTLIDLTLPKIKFRGSSVVLLRCLKTMGRIQIRSGNLKKFAVCRYLYTTVTYKLDGLPAQQVISDMGDLSISLNGRGYRKEALDLMAEARNILRAAPPAVPENDIGETWVGLAFNDIKLGDLKAAEDDVARGMACKIGLGSSKLHRLRCRTAICLEKRDFRQAEVLGLELHKRLLATDRPDVPLDLRGESSRMLFDTLCAQKKFEQARRCLAEDIEDLKKRLPESKPLLMHQFNTLQGFYRSRHDHASVDAVMEQMKPYESDPFVQNQIPSCRSQSQK